MPFIVNSLVHYLCLFDWFNTNNLKVLRQELFVAQHETVNIQQKYHNQYTVSLLNTIN